MRADSFTIGVNSQASPITFECAKTEQQFEEVLALIYHQHEDYLEPKLDLVQLTADQFGRYLRTTGVVYRILIDRQLAGMCWVEEKGEKLHLHGLVVDPHLQGQGIGTQALKTIENIYRSRLRWVELWVHGSNRRARALYERCGFQTVEFVHDTGFFVMQKALTEESQRKGL